jgi:hypothetical protein
MLRYRGLCHPDITLWPPMKGMIAFSMEDYNSPEQI